MSRNQKRRDRRSGKPSDGPNFRPPAKAGQRKGGLGLCLAVIAGAIALATLAFVFIRLKPGLTPGASRDSGSAGVGSIEAPQARAARSGTNAPFSSNPDPAGHAEDERGLSEAELAVNHLTRGNELLAQGKTEEAVQAFERSLKYDAGSEDTHYNLAIALARLGREDEAIQHYKESLKILPDYAEAHNNLGNLLVKRGQFDEAVEHFNEGLIVNPDSASTHNNLGRALAQLGKITDATIHFAKAIQLMPKYVEAHYNLGNAYVTQGRIDEALEQFQETLRIQPDFTPALRALAKAQQRKNP
ncbi:MAG: tetratricopeptide repeat protein [Verrucomicrobia bacterium]|nr:tetratricopeptide repeat protein [Verrucomicrobiota bacterium]